MILEPKQRTSKTKIKLKSELKKFLYQAPAIQLAIVLDKSITAGEDYQYKC
jgi:hypothetical protein